MPSINHQKEQGVQSQKYPSGIYTAPGDYQPHQPYRNYGAREVCTRDVHTPSQLSKKALLLPKSAEIFAATQGGLACFLMARMICNESEKKTDIFQQKRWTCWLPKGERARASA